MKSYVQRDENITVTAAETATSGGGVLLDALLGVASGDAAIGEPLVLVTAGVFEMPKVATDDVSVGEREIGARFLPRHRRRQGLESHQN